MPKPEIIKKLAMVGINATRVPQERGIHIYHGKTGLTSGQEATLQKVDLCARQLFAYIYNAMSSDWDAKQQADSQSEGLGEILQEIKNNSVPWPMVKERIKNVAAEINNSQTSPATRREIANEFWRRLYTSGKIPPTSVRQKTPEQNFVSNDTLRHLLLRSHQII
ncbi:hypothetical protein M1403_01690 [Patescibacteria group bacterium]|nr:hypothetical protein [Patescibacteria group bacterium]